MTGLDAIVTHLRQAVDHLHRALTQVQGTRDMAEELRDLFDRLGTHDLVERMRHVIDRAEDLERILLAGVGAGQQLIAQTEAVRHGSTAGGPLVVPTPAVPAAKAPEPDPPRPTWGMPILAGPDGLSNVLDALPTRPNDEGPTTGQLFRPGGRTVPNGKLRSSRDLGLMADLNLDRKGRRSEAMASHVEAKAAAVIRRGHAPKHSTLVINNADGPCGWLAGQQGEPRSGTSCDELLCDALPEDSSLTVLWRDRRGIQRSQIYRGTGRGIRR